MERPAIRPLRADCTASHTHNAMTSGISPSAAIDMIRKRQAVRVYAETPALKLLGLEDKYAARLKWKQQFEKPITDSEKQTLDSVRNELAKRQNADLIVAREEFRRRNKISSYFPDEGPLRRELYPRHMEFVDATRTDDEVGMLAANRTGKTQLGAICVSNWATGRYPDWWNGRTFDGPTTGWIMNKTAKDVRDINEAELLGPPGHEAERGTGMIPAHLIQKCTPKPGTPHAFEFISVEHASGGTSYIVSKSYDQGREAFQGRAISYGWADEEISLELWDECRLRTMTTSGILIFSYTPINGLTEMTMNFMESAGLSIEQMRNQGAV